MNVKPGRKLGRVFIPFGKTVAVPKSRAESLLKAQKCVESDSAEADFPDVYGPPNADNVAAAAFVRREKLETPASELASFTHYTALNKVGLTTVEGLKNWLSDETKDAADAAAKLELEVADVETIVAELEKADVETIVAELEKADKPAAKPKAKGKPTPPTTTTAETE